MNLSSLNLCVLGVIGLLAIGMYGLLTARNLIKVVIILQILVKSAILGLVTAGSASGQINLSQSLATTVIVADTVVAVVGMALAVQVRRQFGDFDLDRLTSLRG